MMVNGQKTEPLSLEVAETKVAAAAAAEEEEKVGRRTHMAVAPRLDPRLSSRRADLVRVALRLMCMAASVTAMSFMLTARQVSAASFYGFQLHLYSKWSFSYAFAYVDLTRKCILIKGNVSMDTFAAATGYSLLQSLICGSRLMRMSPVIPSRSQAWFNFAADQIFACAMISAGSAASGVTNLNRTGIRHTALPNFCKALDNFCDHVAISIAFTFISCVFLMTSAIQDVIWLSKY
ncbi:CASP-like protein 3A2 isoform X1 [Carica papaya]|uniref:CASP-like protein 3A2 isoform X1 n=1 Tax=Carica papaya TaxID=3649 RepID=UPI000B8C9EE3|nr:CASP-like protein 3A2 isoform X1 [Carica papaya]